MKIPSAHVKSPNGKTEATPPEHVPTQEPATHRWVIVVGRKASCNALALTFVDWMVLLVDGHTAQHRSSLCSFYFDFHAIIQDVSAQYLCKIDFYILPTRSD